MRHCEEYVRVGDVGCEVTIPEDPSSEYVLGGTVYLVQLERDGRVFQCEVGAYGGRVTSRGTIGLAERDWEPLDAWELDEDGNRRELPRTDADDEFVRDYAMSAVRTVDSKFCRLGPEP